MFRNDDGKTIIERRFPMLVPPLPILLLLLLSLLFFCCSDDDDDGEEEEEVDDWCNRVLVLLWRTSNPNVVAGCCCCLSRCLAVTIFPLRGGDVVVVVVVVVVPEATPGIMVLLVGFRSRNIPSYFISMVALLISKMVVGCCCCCLDDDVDSRAGRGPRVAVCKKARATTPNRPLDNDSNKTATIVTTSGSPPGVPPLCLVIDAVDARRRPAIENMVLCLLVVVTVERQPSWSRSVSPCDILLSIAYCWDRLVFFLVAVATKSFVLLCCAGDVFGTPPRTPAASSDGPGDDDDSARSKHILAGREACIESLSQSSDSIAGLDRLRWNSMIRSMVIR
jgi:hypothetical protein